MPNSQAFLAELGARLRRAREAAGLGVSELARQSGVSRRHVTQAEAGRANLSILKLRALSTALGVGIGRLADTEAPPRRGRRIALIGLRGAGKSTVGRLLALHLEVPFVELDRRVEEQAGMTLAEIFDLHGPAAFRRLEAEALEKVLSEGEALVLAAGGSIVNAPRTFERLREACHTVWLRAAPEEHLARVAAQGDRRPTRGHPRALDELRSLLAEREAAYARCELALDTSGREPGEIAAELAGRFGG